ncbi:MAG: hypothetical protein HC906_15780 [Bacteroidales bacterium]|nr:hypothetical protein [Bacteroidales bacterium]
MFYACEKDDTGGKNIRKVETTALFNPEITYGTITDLNVLLWLPVSFIDIGNI